ncbi:anthranilate synthase component I family protein [Exiguobacterium himgiriensis]|uniref:anthranilate synthase component I family protein n=2 Tax=Exiguobacterium TaxID=33986 RepID=UPI0021B08CC1|nr:anthranilate synthase component I family protein [Exiguobacterium himgiriensis]
MRTTAFKTIHMTKQKMYDTYLTLTEGKSHYAWLESGRAGRYTMAGVEPFGTLHVKDHTGTLTTETGVEALHGRPLDIVETVRSRYAVKRPDGAPPFFGGMIGYVSYDVARTLERLPREAADDLATPDVSFLLFDEVAVFDEEDSLLYLMVTAEEHVEAKLDRFAALWQTETHYAFAPVVHRDVERARSLSQEQFVAAVQTIQDYIVEGDVFQVNLSVRQSEPLLADPRYVYDTLREMNPSPYMGYFKDDVLTMVSASPELLIEKYGAAISTRPIAGTRPRGRDEAEDMELARTLLDNEKERAEHVMLVDLERNDLGKVAAYGTVHVDELMVIEKYSHVQHIVSNVRGLIQDGVSGAEALGAMFPGGTITGAPKIRTMEIIEELEPVRRGIYTGSYGWISWDDDLVFNITIRTMIVKDGTAYVQAGAGIVIDSDPVAEYEESLSKAKALWAAKAKAEETT